MEDRLSELPDSLLLVILSLLPMTDVVKTTLLSKRWKDLWTTVACLDFWDRNLMYTRYNSDEFRRFVYGALALWKGAKIQKFSIGFELLSHAIDIDSWLRFPFDKRVEELNLRNMSWRRNRYRSSCSYSGYTAPQRLYSCSSLRKLSVVSCKLEILESVPQWNQLKSLTIEGKEAFTEHGLNQVLSGSPVLEELNLCISEDMENLTIRSSSLKLLKITRCLESFVDDVEKDAVLSIWAPGLETLEIAGIMYTRCLLNVPSLTNAILDCCDRHFFLYKEYNADLLLEEMLGQFYVNICQVENLTLSDWFMKVLLSWKKKGMFAPVSNATFLKLYASATDEVVAGLELFPKLMWLNVRFNSEMEQKFNIDFLFDEHPAVESDADNPSFSLLHLTTVEITWTLRDASIIRFIEILLKHTPILNDMEFFATSPKYVPGAFFRAKQRVTSMPRASPTAKVYLFSC